MELFWPDSFDEQLERLEEEADRGDASARAVFEYVVAEMDYLRRLATPLTRTPQLSRAFGKQRSMPCGGCRIHSMKASQCALFAGSLPMRAP